MKTCKKCGEEKPIDRFEKCPTTRDGRRGGCRDCSNALRRTDEWREKERKYRDEWYRAKNGKIVRHQAVTKYRSSDLGRETTSRWRKTPRGVALRKKENARAARLGLGRIYMMVRRKLKKEPCVKCGKLPAQAHHHDYSRPLDVVWLCSKHHAETHKDIRRAAR